MKTRIIDEGKFNKLKRVIRELHDILWKIWATWKDLP
jgi:hypothetical protein